MNLRCADGDIAVITWDYPECLENLGRLVKVSGPVRMESGLAKWYICPVTPELYAVQEIDGSFVRESVTWDSNVIHPDSWMIPVREQDSERELEFAADLVAADERAETATLPIPSRQAAGQGADRSTPAAPIGMIVTEEVCHGR